MEKAQPDQLTEVYDRVLSESFPPAELVARDDFVDSRTPKEVLVHVIGDEIAAAVVGEYSAATGLLVIEYLAVVREHRGAGSGSALFRDACQFWNQTLRPGAYVAEIERPDSHSASIEHGDPVRRLEFYRRLKVAALKLPYYQPALRPGAQPVPDLLLGIRVEDPSWRRDDMFTAGDRLAVLLTERNKQPTTAERGPWHRLLDSCTNEIPLLDLADFAAIPRSGPVS